MASGVGVAEARKSRLDKPARPDSLGGQMVHQAVKAVITPIGVHDHLVPEDVYHHVHILALDAYAGDGEV